MFKPILLNFTLIFCASQLSAQTAFTYLDQNNVKAALSTGGTFFHNTGSLAPGYEYPAQSNDHLIYATAFWFGGKDINGQVKLSGQKYTQGQDLFPGPLTNDGTASVTPATVTQYDRMWTVTKAEIDNHIANYSSGSYTMPADIEDWPAHGDMVLNQDYYQAPFVDVNANGLYDPANGDYPLIRGDKATYMILNDKANAHSESGADPIGIECHFMFYQYSTNDDLNNTTFVNIKLINRGTQTIYDFAVASFLDADVGTSTDDFMGCDSNLNVVYAYNGSNADGNYGTNPPAVGIVSLNHNLGTAGGYTGASGATAIPSTAAEYHLSMTGYWNDGSPRTLGGNGYGGSTPNKFQYHGNPNNAGEWSEQDEGNLAGERRMIAATETITLQPNDEICYDFAVVVGDGGNNLENVNNLLAATTFVQDFYDNQTFVCENYEQTLQLPQAGILTPHIYPVPTDGLLNVSLPGEYDLNLYSIDGRLVSSHKNLTDLNQLEFNLQSGTYLLEITQNGQHYTQTIVLR